MISLRAVVLVPLAFWGGAALPQSLPADYWNRPLTHQGLAPPTWPGEERSLNPEACGACHGDKLEEWRTSLHAGAFSPGLVGQLLTLPGEDVAACLQCHAPLAEQFQAFVAARGRGKAHLRDGQGLAAAGNSCGGCHLRGHRHYGPPQRGTGAVGQGDADAPHGGVLRAAEFEKSEFCAACHQFTADQAVNGKPLENTLEEWRASPAASAGRTCQSCHMPDRQHLWRGIHDPAMVQSGLVAEFVAGPVLARFRLTNAAVGHAFPTYVTPKVTMNAAALDHLGRLIEGSEVQYVIQRRVEFSNGAWVERWDTRLSPGQSAVLEMAWPPSGKVRMWLEVSPDDFYDHDVYNALLRQLPARSAAANLIAEADRRAQANRYRLFERELVRPPRNLPGVVNE